tara:strand:- start:222 stop:923 length:702 start_codon:yes stop_codon:yes gene_type:complete
MSNLDIIIPIFNEGNNLTLLIRKIRELVKIPHKILICYDKDDESGLQFLPKYENIVPVKNNGLGPNEAIKTGFKYSSSKIILVYMSDDFENIGLINKMYYLIDNKNYDFVIPSRYVQDGEFKNAKLYKKIITNIGSYLIYNMCGIPFKDCTNAFKMFKRDILYKIELNSKIGFTFAIELTIKSYINGFKIIEIPSIWKDLPNRKSNFKVFRWLPYYIYWLIYALFFNIKKNFK